MSAIFQLPRQTLFDANGEITTIGSVRFFAATTTTPLTVYSNSGLSIAISQPIQADSAGRLPKIYITTGAYKVVYYSDAAGSIPVYTEDNCDTGIPAGSGALPVANGGTGATTAAGARTNLAAASQTDLNTQAAALAVIQAQIAALPGAALGDIAGLDTLTRAYLATGFGSVVIQRAEVASATATSSSATTTPADDTIPQSTEGFEVLNGNFTPLSATSTLEVMVQVTVGCNTANANTCAALFQNTDLSAIAARWLLCVRTDTAEVITFVHRMASPGTSAVAFKVRIGTHNGTVYVNGSSSGRVGGGIVKSSIYVTEYQAY